MNINKSLFLIAPMLFVAFGFYLKIQDEGEDILMKAVNASLQGAHYDPAVINDEFSEKAFKLYLKNLDANKRLLSKSDMKQLDKFEKEIDDEIKNGTYNLFNASIKLVNKQTTLTEQFFEDILAQPFDFNINEEVDFDEEIPYAKNDKELKDRWRKYLKYSVLTKLYTDQLAQEKAEEKSDTVFTPKPFDTLEYNARKSVLKTHRDYYSRLKRLERKDRLSMYINSITGVYDPHTNYFPPADKENFDIQMSGQLEGIGAQLQEKDGYIKITNIIPGGPSSLQGDLQANDLILKVKQEGGEAVNIVDWRIDDAVKIIRGKKGTKVTLTVRKPDGAEQDITITRDVVILEETYAKSLLLNDKDNVKTGYIYLPSFYADFRNPRGRFSWKDVKAEVEKLKTAGVKGIILDLRSNGGGSLDDVVKMGGLFIDEGPIVQVKEKGRKPQVLADRYAGAEWDGALVIMINEFSASASEIMAAAMQDYGRAVIVGSSSSHGKGTVQRFLNLNQTIRNKNIPDLGSIKLTIQKFYRINGDATQLKGVSSDILLPDNYMYIKTGEKEQDYPMAWDQIESASYDSKSYQVKKSVFETSNARVQSNETFKLIEENARRWEKQRESRKYPLSIAKYALQEEKQKAEGEKFEILNKLEISGFEVSNIPSDLEKIKTEESRMKINKDWIKSINKDPYVYESLQIIEDLN
ncbi:carboxy terminal-processing peptidase [Bacteroidia bacterium]|jgi:carboxyl-terminal processing protease|nr:carboxy terminal-processing peptidase [Bacteroidia bacterium]|tara:strand:- start:1137 stop:3218 length:2082 start_codon:yes stop_codon:yes gene_type:complete